MDKSLTGLPALLPTTAVFRCEGKVGEPEHQTEQSPRSQALPRANEVGYV